MPICICAAQMNSSIPHKYLLTLLIKAIMVSVLQMDFQRVFYLWDYQVAPDRGNERWKVRATNRREKRSMLFSPYQSIYISSLVREGLKGHPRPMYEVDSTLKCHY